MLGAQGSGVPKPLCCSRVSCNRKRFKDHRHRLVSEEVDSLFNSLFPQVLLKLFSWVLIPKDLPFNALHPLHQRPLLSHLAFWTGSETPPTVCLLTQQTLSPALCQFCCSSGIRQWQKSVHSIVEKQWRKKHNKWEIYSMLWEVKPTAGKKTEKNVW